MWRIFDNYFWFIYRMGAVEWFLVLFAVLVMGMFCLRGFGSRNNY